MTKFTFNLSTNSIDDQLEPSTVCAPNVQEINRLHD